MKALLAVKFIATVTLICATLFTSGSAQGTSNLSQRNDIINTCSDIQFRCRNGDCIQSELLCDGRADCTDQSDETQAECTKPELTCPDYTFRCTYGACVNGDATCNGVRDCLDNSDETLAKCPGFSGADPDEGCRPEDYRCQNGQCISSTSVCDGSVECTDGSDETFKTCGSFPCSQLVFRCNYGACIDGDLTCNNVSNCADGSDEDPLLCGRPGPRPPTERPPITTSTSTTSPFPVPINPVSSDCVVPPQPENGFWKLEKSLCPISGGREVDCDIPQGTGLPPGYKLVYGCSPGYKIRGYTEVHCEHGGKWAKLPFCGEILCGALNSPAATASCTTRSGQYISCDSAVPPGTRATISCRPGYEPAKYTLSRNTVVSCNDDGKWSPTPVMCIPVCGTSIGAPQTPLIINGTPAKLADFPWHATLYREVKGDSGVKKRFQCGATIIRTNLVMTAAHCIYDEGFMATVPAKELWIMTGNIFRDFDSPLHGPTVRNSRVKTVFRKCEYYGLKGLFGSDIALLELETPFELSNILLPACLDTDLDFAQILEVGAVGKIAGFGRTKAGVPSANLQTLKVPYVSYTECRSSSTANDGSAFISNDKFCAGYKNGSAVCQGDSGGGLVFQKSGLWYAMGVVSLGLGANFDDGEVTCDAYSYALFTKVPTYIGWIQKIIFDLENYKQSTTEC